jgi:predicted nucleic acid-binding protein
MRPMLLLDTNVISEVMRPLAKSRDFTLAARNTPDFEQTAANLINPWTSC